MKTFIKTFLAVSAVALIVLSGCNKENDYNNGEPAGKPDTEKPDKPSVPETPELKPIDLTADPLMIILEQDADDEVAVTLSWTDGNKYDGDVVYTLTLSLYGNPSENTKPFTVSEIKETTRTFTVKELNDLAVKTWQLDGGEKVTIEARIKAIVGTEVKAESEAVFFDVTPYGEAAAYRAISMVGPATPNGWAAASATPLDRNGKIFEWEGELQQGTLRFLCNPLSGVSDADAWSVDQFIAEEKDLEVVTDKEMKIVLAAVSEQDRGDNMWKITVPGKWRISLDTEKLTIVFTLLSNKLNDCPDVAMIGPASPGGWDMNRIVNLTKNGWNWIWTGHLNVGEIQFLCDRGTNQWGKFRLVPDRAGETVFPGDEAKRFEYMPSAEDWKWYIGVAGEYNLTIDSQAQTVNFHLTESDASKAGHPSLGLIGDAAPQGWSQEDYSASTLVRKGDSHIYEWEGHLNGGDLNIFCDTSKTDWSSPRLTAWNDGTEVESGNAYHARYKENENKWLIKVAGIYKVTVDLSTMTVVYNLVKAD